jgi:ankyrin repeat protein
MQKLLVIFIFSTMLCFSMHYPLHQAVKEGDEDGVRLLIEAGIDVNQKDQSGSFPIMWIHNWENNGIASLLVAAGAHLNVQDEEGFTPLHYAVLYGCEKNVVLLIGAQADVNKQNNYGDIPLHYAVLKNHKNIIHILLRGGTYLNVINNDDVTPVELADDNAYGEIAALLKNVKKKRDNIIKKKYCVLILMSFRKVFPLPEALFPTIIQFIEPDVPEYLLQTPKIPIVVGNIINSIIK